MCHCIPAHHVAADMLILEFFPGSIPAPSMDERRKNLASFVCRLLRNVIARSIPRTFENLVRQQ